MGPHIIHFPMEPPFKPFFESDFGDLKIDAGNGDVIKTEFSTPSFDLFGQQRHVDTGITYSAIIAPGLAESNISGCIHVGFVVRRFNSSVVHCSTGHFRGPRTVRDPSWTTFSTRNRTPRLPIKFNPAASNRFSTVAHLIWTGWTGQYSDQHLSVSVVDSCRVMITIVAIIWRKIKGYQKNFQSIHPNLVPSVELVDPQRGSVPVMLRVLWV